MRASLHDSGNVSLFQVSFTMSSMVVPTRSQNSSWHSLWDLRGTQAPQLRQSNNTLGGKKVLRVNTIYLPLVHKWSVKYINRC